MTKLLLVDSDFILYKTCFNSVTSETEQMYGVKSEKTLQETLDLIDWYLEEKIFKPTKADYYIGFLGGIGNYRYSVDLGYKAGRSADKPPYFKEAKQYLVDKYKFVIVDGIEAEDAVGITLESKYQSILAGIYEVIIVGQDHDLAQLPGMHFNPVKAEWRNISTNEACYNLWRQMIEGCTTDKVKGIVNNRKNFVKKTIGEYKDSYLESSELSAIEYSFRPLILEKYIELYGEYKGIETYAKNYKLLKILREKEDFIIPEIQSVNKQSVEQQIIPEF